jgi:hypothetical protein
MMDLTADPISFPAGLAVGLEPGMLLMFNKSTVRPWLPMLATKSASSSVPVFLMGGAAK